MKTFLSFIAILFIQYSQAQPGKIVTIPTYNNQNYKADTSLRYIWNKTLSSKIGLEDLENSTDSFHFRYWTDKQVLDVWTPDYKTFFGTVTNYARRYNKKLYRKGIYKIDRIFSRKVIFDSARTKEILDVVENFSLTKIPSQEKIKGWTEGLDGEEFIMENSTPTKYDFKIYWSPGAFEDKLKEAKVIQTFVIYMRQVLDTYGGYQKLKLPQGYYQQYGNGIPGIMIESEKLNTNGATKVTDLL